VWQPKPGQATILITLNQNEEFPVLNFHQEFDTNGINMEFQFNTLIEPVYADSGKVPLLVKKIPNLSNKKK
jgi:hypothetical protein